MRPGILRRSGIGLLAIALAAATPLGAQDAPPPAVVVTPVVVRDVTPSREFMGRVEAIQAVDVRALVQGILQQVAFHEGQDVKAGQLLFAIEPSAYQAALAAAQAQLARAQATLQQAEQNLAREQELRSRGVAAQAVLEQAIAQRGTAAADVALAQANVQTAQINLGYTRISAPFAGRIGQALVTMGNLVGPSTGPLARIVQLDPIRVVYSVDDRTLLEVQQRRGTGAERLTAQYVPRLRLSDGQMFGGDGRVDFVGNEVDPATGTVPIRAAFANPQGFLLPGQFVTVVVRPAETANRLVVPVTAVQEDRQGKFVLVVGPDDRVQERRITADRQFEQDWVVDQGLRQGENVIVQGLQKVRPGMVVHAEPARPPAQASR